jgi:cyclophilin family peptidyl-prolyl cis-trans isomerase
MLETLPCTSSIIETPPPQRKVPPKPPSRYCGILLWTLIGVWLTGVAVFVCAHEEFFPTITEPAFLGGQIRIQIQQPLVLHEARLPIHWPLPLPVLTDELLFSSNKQLLILTISSYGQIHILLRPDLSQGSVRYIHDLVERGCARCYFHRKVPSLHANQGFVLGTLANHQVPLNTIPGNCPSNNNNNTELLLLKDKDKDNKDPMCGVWNTKQCGCHGPILTKGMVGWVEGTVGGPDFFINTQSAPLENKGTKYTVFGQVVVVGTNDDDDGDVDSFHVLQEIMETKATMQRAQVFREKIAFRLSLPID